MGRTTTFSDAVLLAITDCAERAAQATGTEAALCEISETVFATLGRRETPKKAGALKQGERQFFVCGFFLLDEAANEQVLVAERGFPAEQHRLRIGADVGHPGWVVQNRRALILANTDEHADFKQILRTSRMGSALYAPMFWGERLLGQLIMAAQARGTFSEPDLAALRAFAGLASHTYVAQGLMRL